MTAKAPVIVLSGTNRPGANTLRVARHVSELMQLRLRASTGFEAKLLDLQQLRADIFSPRAYEEKPQWFTDLFQRPIFEAAGMVVVTPEYNGSVPGALKYFLDMLEFPKSLAGLPVAFVGVSAGQFGGLRPIDQLAHIFSYRRAHIFGERLYIPDINSVLQQEKGDAEWSVGPHEDRLHKLVDSFLTFVQQHAPLQVVG